MGERRGACRFGWGNLRERERIQEIGLDGRKIFKIQLGSHWTDFHEILYLLIFRKSVEKFRVLYKLEQEYRVLYM
jgi:hypothetical protein